MFIPLAAHPVQGSVVIKLLRGELSIVMPGTAAAMNCLPVKPFLHRDYAIAVKVPSHTLFQCGVHTKSVVWDIHNTKERRGKSPLAGGGKEPCFARICGPPVATAIRAAITCKLLIIMIRFTRNWCQPRPSPGAATGAGDETIEAKALAASGSSRRNGSREPM